MTIVAKFECVSVTTFKGGTEEVKFSAAIQGDENKAWSKFTPSGSITMSVGAEGAVGQFKPGQNYLLTFTEMP